MNFFCLLVRGVVGSMFKKIEVINFLVVVSSLLISCFYVVFKVGVVEKKMLIFY